IPRERDIVQPAKGIGNAREPLIQVEPAREHQIERLFQLLQQLLLIDIGDLRRSPPIHLAIDAVEVANLIRIQVDPDRDPPAPPRQNRIDIEVLVKQPGMVAVRQKMLVGWSLWQGLHKTHRAFAKPASWFPACQRGRSCAGRLEQVSSPFYRNDRFETASSGIAVAPDPWIRE